MIPLHIAVCEDTPLDAERLCAFISNSGVPCDCTFFLCGEALLQTFWRGKYDIVFMDIYMEGMLGTDVARRLREADHNVGLVFTTTSQDHALESYRLDALNYIEKPVSRQAVEETIALALLKRKMRKTITLMIDGSNEEIPLDTVLYFEQKQHNVTINTTSGLLRTSRTVKLSELEKRLASDSFLRTHYSYLVNLRYVQKIDRTLFMFTMENGENVHIRRENFKKVKEAYEAFLFAMARGEHRG